MRSRSLHALFAALILVSCSGRALVVGSNGDAGPRSHDAADIGTGTTRTPSGEGGPAGGPDADADPCVSIEAESMAIRERSCVLCHGEPQGFGGFNYVMDDTKLASSVADVAVDDAGMRLRIVVPGDPEGSYLYQRVAGGQMPPPPTIAAQAIGRAAASNIVYPNASDESILYEWILSCMGVNGRALRASDASYGPPMGGDDSSAPDGSADEAGNQSQDASEERDAGPIALDALAPPPGLAGFALVVNGLPRTPLACPSDYWEYNSVDGNGQLLCDQSGACASGTTAVLVNTGQVPIAYTARASWTVPYPPGVPTGEPDVLVGVLAPQGQVDITSVFAGGLIAILGSAQPFSNPDAGKYAGDEGTIPWPAGVAGSGGATQMQVAQIDMVPSCHPVSPYW